MQSDPVMSPAALKRLLAKEPGPLVVDVRTPAEFEAIHVRGAKLMPLQQLDAEAVRRLMRPGEPVYLLCHSGSRAAQAQRALAAAGLTETVVVEGGTVAAEAAGLPVERGRKAMPLNRRGGSGATACAAA